MDIIIKSFNRPYYLERCLRSIEQNVKGNYRILVLDDGTPPAYLEQIRALFPSVRISYSENHREKIAAISEHLRGGKQYDLKTIPGDFWKREIEGASDIFLLLEDDAWLTSPVNLDLISNIFNKHELVTLKLFWGGNPLIVKGSKVMLGEDLEEIIPALPIRNLILATLLLTNKLKFRSALTKTGLIGNRFLLPYYTLYTVSSAFFRKEYWMYVWNNTNNKVDEGRQLLNALKWKQEHPASRYAKTVSGQVNTSFITSSTNPFRVIDFDFIRFHHILNEAWLAGALDPMQGYPQDFPEAYLEAFLGENQSAMAKRWRDWIALFKGQHRSIGSVTE